MAGENRPNNARSQSASLATRHSKHHKRHSTPLLSSPLHWLAYLSHDQQEKKVDCNDSLLSYLLSIMDLTGQSRQNVLITSLFCPSGRSYIREINDQGRLAKSGRQSVRQSLKIISGVQFR